MVLLLAWAYVQYGSQPQAGGLLYGIKPVVIAIIAQALWNLGRKAVKRAYLAGLGLAVLVGYFLGANEIALLFGGGLAAMLWGNFRRMRGGAGWGALLAALPGSKAFASLVEADAAPRLAGILLNFLKIGAVLYGSGYVLLAFLRADFVVRLGWLTDQQLIDAVAIGQVTPGPVFTTATFIGYLLGGVPGALAATLGIFLPSFLFVGLSNPLIPRMRASAWVGGLLDGVNVASLGLMAAVSWQLGRASLVDPLSALIALVALGLLVRFRVNTTWLIAGGGIIGLLSAAWR
jgi:chromate transporter